MWKTVFHERQGKKLVFSFHHFDRIMNVGLTHPKHTAAFCARIVSQNQYSMFVVYIRMCLLVFPSLLLVSLDFLQKGEFECPGILSKPKRGFENYTAASTHTHMKKERMSLWSCSWNIYKYAWHVQLFVGCYVCIIIARSTDYYFTFHDKQQFTLINSES